MNTERYQRQIVLPDVGVEGQRKLLASRVLIVGAGGLGVPVLQYLVGMGVGKVAILDGDEISLSNLHRQVIYTTKDVGRKKVEVAKERLEQLNPEVELMAIPEMLSLGNAEELIRDYDLVVDCTDTIESRYILNDACVKLGKPFVYGALYRHEGHVSVFNHQGSASYRDIYPDDSVQAENCNEIGVLGVLPGIIGCYQAMEVVKVLTGFGESLAGRLMVINAATSEQNIFFLGNRQQKSEPVKRVESTHLQTISWEELEQRDLSNTHLIDVRSFQDFEAYHDPRFENIPLSIIAGFEPNSTHDVILVCDQGKTTRQAAAILAATYSDIHMYHLEGGYQALEK